MLYVTCVFAQQTTLSISPPLLETVIKPGKNIVVAYRVQNLADPVIIKAQVRPFVPKDSWGNIKISRVFGGPLQFSLDNTGIRLEEPFFLRTRENTQLVLRLTVPPDTAEGDYYYTLLLQTQPPPQIEGITSSRSQLEIGSNILVTVTESGTVDVKGKIALFDLFAHYKLRLFKEAINIFDSQDKIPLTMIVQNNGKNSIKPQGEVVLRGNFGERATYTIVPANILAQSQRQIRAQPSAIINCDSQYNLSYYCRSPASLTLAGFFVGRYTLSTSVSFGEGTPNLFATVSFIAIPFRFIIGLIVIIGISILIIHRFADRDS